MVGPNTKPLEPETLKNPETLKPLDESRGVHVLLCVEETVRLINGV
jgi:hypothetical protein